MGVKLLVTGGAGYLGCVLVSELLKRNCSVKVLDLMLHGYQPILDEVEFIKGDVRDVDLMDKLTSDVDVCIHLAAIVGDTACDLNKDLATRTNYLATKNLAELCKKKNIKFVFASTCSVYGAQPEAIITEESPVAPLSIYSLTKLAAEERILRLSDKEFKPIIFRMGTIHGYSNRMRFDLVGNLFIAKALNDEKIVVYGGNQYRPLPHIRDAANAYISAIQVDASGIFNLGGINYKILDLAKTVASIIPCKIEAYEEMADKRNYKVSSEKAYKTFGITFNRGIEESVKEITQAFSSGIIKNYKGQVYVNAKRM